MLTEYFAVEAGLMGLLPAKACEAETYFRSSLLSLRREATTENTSARRRLMGLREPRKRRGSRKCKVREVGTSLNSPPLPKGVETGLMGLRKSRKRGGSRECKVPGVGKSLTRPPPKKVLYVLQRFFRPVGDERSLIVILFSDW